jgi:hypothetical protein
MGNRNRVGGLYCHIKVDCSSFPVGDDYTGYPDR